MALPQEMAEQREARAKYAKLLETPKPAARAKKGLTRFEQVQKECLDIAMDVCRSGEGGLIVIGKTKSYRRMFPNFFQKHHINVLDKGMDKVLAKLATIDGAVVVHPDGEIMAYGAHITRSRAQQGAGTRHAAAKGISGEKNMVAIVASEEGKVVRLFKDGRQVVEINPHTKGVEQQTSRIVRFVNSPDGALAAGAAIAIPFVGIPGVIVFAGSYYVAKNLLKLTKKE